MTNINSDNNNANERPHYWRYPMLIAASVVMSLIYTMWFVVEIVQDGIQSNWQFFLPGLLVMVGIQVVVIAVLILSAIQWFWQSQWNDAFLYFTIPALDIIVAVGYFGAYIPLQSDFFIWLLRWVPWGVLSMVTFCVPCCGQRQPQPAQEVKTAREPNDEELPVVQTF